MTCNDFVADLCVPGDPSREMRRHAVGCAHCRLLLDVERGLREGSGNTDLRGHEIEMSIDLRRLIAEQRGGPPSYSVSKRAAVPVGLALLSFAIVLTIGRRPGFGQTPVQLFILSTVGLLAMFASGLALLLNRKPSGSGPSRSAGALFFAAAGVAYSLIIVVTVRWSTAGPCRPAQIWLAKRVAPTLGIWVKHLPCAALGVCAGSVVLAACLWAGTRTSTAAPRMAGAVSGATAAMAGALTIFPFCASHAAAHIFCVHTIPIAILILAGTMLGPRTLAP